MKRFRFMLFGEPKEFWAHNRFDFASRWRKSYPQFKHLTFTDFKDLTIIN